MPIKLTYKVTYLILIHYTIFEEFKYEKINNFSFNIIFLAKYS